MILTLLLIIPFLGALLLSLWPQGATPAQLRRLTLIILSVQCIASFAVLFWFDPSNPGLQLQERLPWLPSVGLDYSLAIDGISLPLVLMNACSVLWQQWHLEKLRTVQEFILRFCSSLVVL